MPVKVQIDGVGTVELDDGFSRLPPEQQQATIDEITSSAKQHAPAASPGSPAPQASAGGSPAPAQPRGNDHTYQALERFIKAKYPSATFTSDYRDPQHNKDVGGVEGSYHTTYQAVDMTGLDANQRAALKHDLSAAGVNPREFLFHNAGSGDHLHIAADKLPDDFLKQWGPQAAPAPVDASAPAAQAPSADRQAEIESVIAQASGLIQAGKEKEAIDLLGQHRLSIQPGELDAFHAGKRSAGFNHKTTKADEFPVINDESELSHLSDVVSDNVGRGVLDSLGDVGMVGPGLISAATGNGSATDILQKLYSLAAPNDPSDGSALDRYVAAASRGAGAAAAVPVGPTALRIASGVGAGVGGEVGHDIAPDSTVAPLIGSLVGGLAVGGPKVARAAGRERFVARAAKDPRGAYLPGAVDALATKAADVAPNGIVPRGRAKLDVKQINAVANQHFVGLENGLSRLTKAGTIEPQQADALKQAIQRRNSITKPEIDTLRGTPEGDAVAEAINHYQTVEALTPAYNGGRTSNLLNKVVEAAKYVPGNPVPAKALEWLGRATSNGDVNASRIRAADKAISKKPLYDKLKDRVGPSSVAPAMDTFKQRVAETYAPQEATPRGARLSPADALIRVNIESGVFGRHNLYADSLGVKRADVERVLQNVNTDDIPAFEMEKFRNGYPISKTVRTALLPRLRKALADDGVTPAEATNQATKASPAAEGAASDERIYRPVEDQARYDRGKSRAQGLMKYEREQFERQMPKEVIEATKGDIDHIIDIERTSEGGIRYFDETTAPKLRQMGMVDDEIADIRSHIERIVTHKRYRTDAAFEAGAKRK